METDAHFNSLPNSWGTLRYRMKRIVFISSCEIESPSIKVGDFDYETEHKQAGWLASVEPPDFDSYCDGKTIFVIDVHCKVGGKDSLQDQAGLAVYRHLLKYFTGKQDRLKVIFYSPVSKDNLVKSKPENYVLKCLPFIECRYDSFAIPPNSSDPIRNTDVADVSGERSYSENEFEHRLISIIVENQWPQFNNSSENLLSGWAYTKKQYVERGNDKSAKIRIGGAKILVIDDEISDWLTTYLTILDNGHNSIIAPKYLRQFEFRNAWDQGDVLDDICRAAENCDAVVSDLYIRENHEDTSPYKLREDIDRLSGFRLFSQIKESCPYLPYMMFTTSNKVWNAEAFQSEGVWAWSVKDAYASQNREAKKAQFEHFESCISKLFNKEALFLSAVWKRHLQLKQALNMNYWWKQLFQDA